MPATTRSQTRRQLEYLKTNPYPTSFLARTKAKYPDRTAKIEELLEEKVTPEPEYITKELINIALKFEEETKEISVHRGLHLLGDIIYKSLTPMRKYIKDRTSPKQSVSEFIREWGLGNIDDDTTPQAIIIQDYIKSDAPKKSRNSKYLQKEFNKWKAWLQIYAARCELVHDGLEDMSGQQLWDALKGIEEEAKNDKVTFADPTWKGYALEAIQEMQSFKFQMSNGARILRGEPGVEIVT